MMKKPTQEAETSPVESTLKQGRCIGCRAVAWAVVLLILALAESPVRGTNIVEGGLVTNTEEVLAKFMNSIPPSTDFFCVSNGPSNRALHPDRAPNTQLARQGNVVLFSGTAPQLGLNFSIPVGSLIYRNQMSTLGGPEPSPQVGTAGTMQQKPWDFFLPWSEARWHPGEDITWQGYRASPSVWIGGLPHWELPEGNTCPDYPSSTIRPLVCGELPGGVHKPLIWHPSSALSAGFGLESAFNLQLARGIYQMSKVRADFSGRMLGECPFAFREPWFQGRGRNPVFNVTLDHDPDPVHLAGEYFPNYLSAYMYEKLELDGGRLIIDFERSATWPREPTMINLNGGRTGGAITGTSMARKVRDEYENSVYFDRVPKY